MFSVSHDLNTASGFDITAGANHLIISLKCIIFYKFTVTLQDFLHHMTYKIYIYIVMHN